MSAVLVYKHFRAIVHFEPAAGVFRGRVLGAAALPSFEGRRRQEVFEAFRAVIDRHASARQAEPVARA